MSRENRESKTQRSAEFFYKKFSRKAQPLLLRRLDAAKSSVFAASKI